jgi:RNA polymerase primary sigma factor
MVRRHERHVGRMERSLECYLREIGRYPLLSREQETALAERIRRGDEEALHDLVRANLRFVVTVAKHYLGQGLSLQDLINEGNIGLMKAGRRFDERRGFKFISYAVWWIRQAILQAIADQSRLVRLPQNRTVVLHRVHRTQGRLQQELGRAPVPAEIARAADLSEREVREALRIGQPEVYLDEVLSEDDGRTLGETLPLESDREDAESTVLERSRREDLDRVLACLPPREAEILRLYFGMSQQTPLTLEQIGGRMGLTRERIRQLKERALGRLRDHALVGVLRDHYEEE